MNRLATIGTILILLVTVADNLAAQQTSSSAQVVTFGVQRASQALLSQIVSVSNRIADATALTSKTLEPSLKTMPVKITYSSKNANGISHSSSFSSAVSSVPRYIGHQQNPRTHFTAAERAFSSSPSLLFTITD